jgi:hypothetical protein
MSGEKRKVKYGILCPSSNLFYEIPDEGTYLALVQELKSKKGLGSAPVAQQPSPEIYAQLMDEEVDNILHDPIFSRPLDDPQMIEYDF